MAKTFNIGSSGVESRTAVLYDPLGTPKDDGWKRMSPEQLGGQTLLDIGPNSKIEYNERKAILSRELGRLGWKFKIDGDDVYPDIADLLIDARKQVIALMEILGQEETWRGHGGGYTERKERRFTVNVDRETAQQIADTFRLQASDALKKNTERNLRQAAIQNAGLDHETVNHRVQALLRANGLDIDTLARKRADFNESWEKDGFPRTWDSGPGLAHQTGQTEVERRLKTLLGNTDAVAE